MCGLWAYFLRHGNLFDATDYVRHDPWKHASANRGPDRMTEVQGSDYHLVFHRLAIHDLSENGDQPFMFEWMDGTVIHLMCNGEIYNYKELVEKYRLARKLRSKSDCEVIAHLFQKFQGDEKKVIKVLQGEYAFVMRVEYPSGDVRLIAARDMFGVRPLYWAETQRGILFSSMLGGLVGMDDQVSGKHFPPGYLYSEVLSETQKCPNWYDVRIPFLDLPRPRSDVELQYNKDEIYRRITSALIHAVKVRLQTDRPIGFLLSGGLDSSLVVAIAVKILGVKAPHTFCIGFDKNATDLQCARKVATFLGTTHHEILMDPKDAAQEVRDVIKAIETYDTTTVRASTAQYILARHIAEKTNIRVIMNGDGSDEVACGYMYNHFAPSAEAAHQDAVRLLNEIHCFDGLRVDRTLGAHGLEARLPFLDPMYVSEYLSVPPSLRVPKHGQRLEKQLLRDAFATIHPGLLPEDILYRRKEAFSDGVTPNGSGPTTWIQELHKTASQHHHPSESAWYKSIFDTHFPHHAHILPHLWMPPKEWVPQAADPSARTLNMHGN